MSHGYQLRRSPHLVAVVLLGFILLPACDRTDGPPRDIAPLMGAEDARDEETRMVARVQGLTRAFQGDGAIADYASYNANAFNIQVLDTAAEAASPADAARQADYWSIIAIRVPPEAEPTPVMVVREAIAGMPPGMNTVSLLDGRPVVIHWRDENGEWMAASIQFYPPGPLAESLRNMVAGPGQPGPVP